MIKNEDKWICSWGNIDEMVDMLYRSMKRDCYQPDFIVGISRGGLIPAVMLSHKFEVPMLPVVWSTRDFIQEDHERVLAMRHHVINQSKNALIVDDICDTGATFRSLQEQLAEDGAAGFAPGVEFASLYVRYNAEFNPTYWAVEVPDESWIVFPFEERPQRKVDIDD